jgi:chromosome segregation ATPase
MGVKLTAAPARRIDKLQYNSQFRKAILQVFGKTVIVRSLELGPQIARTHGLNAITLDGSQLAETPHGLP